MNVRDLDETEFGIYIKTHEPDYHLAKALIASLWRYAPGCPITLIPDDDFTEETLWGIPAMTSHDPFLCRLKGYYKKLWALFGRHERFIYLDADMLALAPLEPLIGTVLSATSPFFIACAESKVRRALCRGDEEEICQIYTNDLGDLDLISAFDPKYDALSRFPFNSGCFAAQVGVVPREAVEEAFDRAEAFHSERRTDPLCFSRRGLFMGDQGFLNYLLAMHGPEVDLVDDLWHWGGRDSPENVADLRHRNPASHLFVHWAGCPRPSMGRSGVPHLSEWQDSYRAFHRETGQPIRLLLDSASQKARGIQSRVRLSAVERMTHR